jgi:carboxyl-terminal processing protease
MKKILIILILLFSSISFPAVSQTLTNEQTIRLSLFCKVWGFLKYYHPAVADSTINWDSTFIKYYGRIKACATNSEFSNVISLLIIDVDSRRDDSRHKTVPLVNKASYTYISVVDDDWLSNPIFSWNVHNSLAEFKNRFSPQNNVFVLPVKGQSNANFINDSSWFSVEFPTEPIRVLALARYWNIINYFYPYKDGLAWDSILIEFMPQLIESTDSAYHLRMLELCMSLTDGQSFTSSTVINHAFIKDCTLPFRTSYVEGKNVILGKYFFYQDITDSILNKMGISQGDVILKVNGVDIETAKNKVKKMTAHSNDIDLQTTSLRLALRGDSGKVAKLILDNGSKTREVSINYLPSPLFDSIHSKNQSWKIIQSNIGYIEFESLKPKDVEQAMKDMLTTDALILDMRGFEKNTAWKVMDYLTTPVNPCLIARPLLTKPGNFFIGHEPPAILMIGKEKKYLGKLVVLVDERTSSHAEFHTMMFQAIDGVKTFGSQTCGISEGVSSIYLPGKITTYMSAMGLYYPDMTPTQRIGLKIDFVVKPTIKGIREGRDEVLEAAVKYLSTNIH